MKVRRQSRGSVPLGDKHFDAIVVGGGHDGLACSAYLAKAGRKVVVLESRDIVGGFCTSEASVPEAPGFLMNAEENEADAGLVNVSDNNLLIPIQA